MTVEAPQAPSAPLEEPEAVEFTIDPHDGEELGAPATEAAGVDGSGLVAPVVGWTAAEAKQLYLAAINVWALPFGPAWYVSSGEAAPEEQFAFLCPLLDRWLPKGAAGMAELGVGLMMVSQSTVQIVVKRWPLVKAGPFTWMRDPKYGFSQPTPPPVRAPQEAPAPPPPAEDTGGSYKLPRDLAAAVAPPPVDMVPGLGI